jgi:hypothetical protein
MRRSRLDRDPVQAVAHRWAFPFVLMLAQQAKLKLRRSDMTIAQGKRGTSATLGTHAPKNFPSPRPAAREAGRGIKGEGFLSLTASQ